jgi:hypothetical protein
MDDARVKRTPRLTPNLNTWLTGPYEPYSAPWPVPAPAAEDETLHWLPVRAGALSQVNHVARLLYYASCRASGVTHPLGFHLLYVATQIMYESMAREILGYVTMTMQ